MITDSDLQLILKKQIKSFTKAVETEIDNAVLLVDENCGVLNLECDPQIIDKVIYYQAYILDEAYLKLGCDQLSIYCAGEHIVDYNRNIDSTGKFMQGTLEKETINSRVESKAKGIAADWLSFQALAEAMQLPVYSVEEEIERFGIPSVRYQGEWGLKKEALDSYLDRHFDYIKGAIKNLMTETQEGVAETNPTTNSNVINLPRNDLPMDLPKNFDLMVDLDGNARKRKPTAQVGLEQALALLPNSKDNYVSYLQQIILKTPSAKKFVEELSSHFTNPNLAKDKIREVTQKLWDELQKEPA